LFWAVDAFRFVLLPGAILLWLARAFQVSPSAYGLGRPRETDSWLEFVWILVSIAIILRFVYHSASLVSWFLAGRPQTVSFYKEVVPQGPFRAVAVLYLAVTAGLVEEVFFRGLPLLHLKMRFPAGIPKGLYVASTAIAFGAIHWQNGIHEVVATTVYGLVAAVFYLNLRDLWPLVGAHALIDAWEFW
jgi:membrane protease YdiL (CAAX protease family)